MISDAGTDADGIDDVKQQHVYVVNINFVASHGCCVRRCYGDDGC